MKDPIRTIEKDDETLYALYRLSRMRLMRHFEIDYNGQEDVQRGCWYVFPTREGDHGAVIGMNGKTEETRKFYTDHITLIDSLPRIR